MAAAGAASGNELSASGATAAASEDIAVEAAAESKLVEASVNGGSQTVVVSYSGEDSDDDEESLDGRSHASWLMRSVFIFSRDDAIDEVLPRLFISGIVPATHMKTLREKRITHIVNCAVEAPSRFKEKRNGFVYLELSLDDIPSQDIREFLDKALANPQHAVLVHCMAGMSRSASMVIAFVMKARRMPYDTALRFVKERRPICMPNPGFHKQLLMMSEELCGIRVSEAEIKRVSSPMWF